MRRQRGLFEQEGLAEAQSLIVERGDAPYFQDAVSVESLFAGSLPRHEHDYEVHPSDVAWMAADAQRIFDGLARLWEEEERHMFGGITA
jgi:hypothetical protein